ncbi:RNA polymerase sigma factor [Caenimonas terrae]|uniref:RNA polymerase sigma factor n=1 Tax=Caenimonas terrae TaxID=696074 RepID=A0ABW0NE97_9BURK
MADEASAAGAAAAGAAAAAAARRSYGKLVAFLAARTRDVAGAEDALAEAFAAALDGWPRSGIPDNPEAWLLTVARRRLADAGRLRGRDQGAAEHFALLAELSDGEGAGELPDRRLELLFACAHPGVEQAARAPLMLQAVLGFDAATIASAFLVAPSTMGQRLVRAKARIREAGIGFQLPGLADLPARLEPVLEAIYAAYAEGWADATGTDARRRNLADEAIWLGRLLAALLPGEPEALGLLALMLHAHARRGGRRDADGAYVPLAQQDTAQWDRAMIDEAEAVLWQASSFHRPGRFQLEAAIQSAHNVRRHGGPPDWHAIASLYEALHVLTGSPVAAINRAVALAATDGPQSGLAALATVHEDGRLADYQPYWAARADLLARAGQSQLAREAYRCAIGLERDPAVREFLQRQESILPGSTRDP